MDSYTIALRKACAPRVELKCLIRSAQKAGAQQSRASSTDAYKPECGLWVVGSDASRTAGSARWAYCVLDRCAKREEARDLRFELSAAAYTFGAAQGCKLANIRARYVPGSLAMSTCPAKGSTENWIRNCWVLQGSSQCSRAATLQRPQTCTDCALQCYKVNGALLLIAGRCLLVDFPSLAAPDLTSMRLG